MCQTPITIKNPNFGYEPKGFMRFKDCTSQYIQVPCGKCPDCIALEQMYMVQRVQMEALKNWLFMATITYKNETIPSLLTEGGYTYHYTDIKHVQDMMKRLREKNTFGIPFRYIAVSERGGKGG